MMTPRLHSVACGLSSHAGHSDSCGRDVGDAPGKTIDSVLPAQVDRLPIDECLEAAFAVLGEAGAGLFYATERHRRLLVPRVHVDVRETGLDAIDIFPRGAEVRCVDRR